MSKWKNIQNHEHYLVCKNVQFYTNKDEYAFFKWIEKIDCIKNISAGGDELYLDLVNRKLTNDDIYDLIGLFARYEIDMKQLGRYKTDTNKEAFESWHKEIFQ